MRSITILLLVFLIPISAQAGTWVEDFEDGNLDGWTVSGGGEWSIQDGKLSGRFIGGGGLPSVIRMEPSAWKDYTVEAKVFLLEKLGGHPEMAFCLRLNPVAWHAYGFCLHFANNHAEIYRHRGFNAGAIQRLASNPRQMSDNTWYKVKCSVSGNHLSFYIDDELCAELDDPGLESGTVAIYISNMHVLIDDIVITGNDIPDQGLAQNSKSVKPLDKLAATWADVKHR